MTIDGKYQVPTVAIHTNIFERAVRSVARVNGMPRARVAFVPQPVMGKSPAELRAYVDGNDPVTGRPVMQEVIEGLTRPFDAQDLEKVAVNAVMAGAEPEYFPVILALAASGVSARGSTTSSAAAMAVVNGPIRHEIGMNCGIGALGPYNHANATIGRAYSLLSQNLQ